MPALVTGHGNGIRILLNGRIYHLFYGAIMAEMNHLATCALNDASHDVDCGVMPIK